MKRLFIFTTLLFVCFTFVKSQTFVSTTPENKNVILEEFTGISCGYCPDGHLIAHGIHDSNPFDVAIIAIHAGGFASPQGAGTDFRTTFGTAIDSYWGISGYPSGTVNRQSVLGRSSWSGAATQTLTQPSPVNVGVQASVDMATNVLTVDVEVYYTGSQTIASNMLNIAVVQNNVEGPQASGSTNPTAMLPNGNYNHQHMLRHMMTGNWGEQITNISPGTLFSNQYTWTIPANINGVALDPTNIGVIAFVTEDNEQILSGTIEVSPSIIFVNSYDAYCMSATANDAICGATTNLEVTFRNYGNQPLTSLDVNYSINGGTNLTYPWTGNLISAGTETISIPNVAFTPQATNSVAISTANPNSNTDQNTSNDNVSTSFAQYSSAGQVSSGFSAGNANINITTDQYGSETTWELLDDNGAVVVSGGPYGNLSSSGTTVQPTVSANLISGMCYSFYIYDSYGDGINTAQYGAGSYTVTDVAGGVIISGGVFTYQDQEHFEVGTFNTVEENSIVEGVSIYPNPTNEIANISFSTLVKSTAQLNITNIIGDLVYSKNLGSITAGKHSLPISTVEIAEGIYFANLIVNNKIINKKITIIR